MGMLVVWSPRARDRLVEITTYVSRHDVAAAERLWQRLVDATEPLSEHPYLYRPGRVEGTRELVVHANYVVVYRVLADLIEIETVLHTRQLYPKSSTPFSGS